MAMEAFINILKEKRPLLFDGAMGTELYNRGIFINRCFEDANLSNPALVKDLHKEYVQAGAHVITTNSWGANRLKLTGHNLHDKLDLINHKAVEIAREAAQDQCWVAGSVGPLGVRIEPYGPTSFQAARDIFKEHISALYEAGIDVLTLETFADISEMQQAILAAKELGPIPIIANVIINTDGLTLYGTPIEWVMKNLDEWDVDVLGLNCSVGPQPMMTCMEKIISITQKPLSVQPNAGLPKQVDGRQIYMSTPEYMATFAQEFFRLGVQFVGGCCGTSPEHIRAMANTMRYSQAVTKATAFASPQEATASKQNGDAGEETPARVPLGEKSNWSKKIAEGETVTSVELLPPPGIDPSQIIARSQQIKEKGVDAINIPDGPRASARMSAVLTAVMIEQQAKIETVLHYTCRDRNLLGMQSDMLGSQAIGLRNMLLITGDPPKLGDYPNTTGVFDIDAIGLTNMVHRLNGGVDLGGRKIGAVPSLSIGVGVNPVHKDFDYEMKRFAWKVDAGAEWAITQPVFDVQALLRFLDYIDHKQLKIPIVAGVWPLLSYRNAIFMNNEVPGVVIPETIIARMEKPQNPEDAKKEGVLIAQEMVEHLQGKVEGFQVSAPFGRIDLALQVLGK